MAVLLLLLNKDSNKESNTTFVRTTSFSSKYLTLKQSQMPYLFNFSIPRWCPAPIGYTTQNGSQSIRDEALIGRSMMYEQ